MVAPRARLEEIDVVSANRRGWDWQPVAWPSGSSVMVKCPRQELNLVLDLRRVACVPAHFEDMSFVSTPPRSRTPSCSSEDCRAVRHTRRAFLFLVARPGIEPGPTASEAVVPSITPTGYIQGIPTWSRTRTKTLGGSCAIHYTIGTQEPTTGLAPV